MAALPGDIAELVQARFILKLDPIGIWIDDGDDHRLGVQ